MHNSIVKREVHRPFFPASRGLSRRGKERPTTFGDTTTGSPPPQMTFEKRVQEFHTDDASLLRSDWSAAWEI